MLSPRILHASLAHSGAPSDLGKSTREQLRTNQCIFPPIMLFLLNQKSFWRSVTRLGKASLEMPSTSRLLVRSRLVG